MSPDQMAQIMNATEPDICKQSTKMGDEPFSFVTRRASTLRCLTNGESFRSFYYQLRISGRICVRQKV